MKNILTLTSVVEGTTGIALLIVPNFVISLLLGTTLQEPAGVFVCRLTGVALITLAVACWLDRNNERGASSMVKAILFYNLAAAVLLVVVGLTGFSGIGLWPAALLHIVLSGWCIKNLL